MVLNIILKYGENTMSNNLQELHKQITNLNTNPELDTQGIKNNITNINQNILNIMTDILKFNEFKSNMSMHNNKLTLVEYLSSTVLEYLVNTMHYLYAINKEINNKQFLLTTPNAINSTINGFNKVTKTLQPCSFNMLFPEQKCLDKIKDGISNL